MGSYHPDAGRQQSRRGFLGTAGLFGAGAAATCGRLLRGDTSSRDRDGIEAPASSSRGVLVPVQHLTFGTGQPWRPVSLVVNHL
jgi:hypothetical protein